MKHTLLFPLIFSTNIIFAQIFFTEIPSFPILEGVRISSVAFSDVDNDNDNDLLITGLNINWNPISRLYINDGAADFFPKNGTPFEKVYAGDIKFSDVNGDNYEDVFITGQNIDDEEIAKLYMNDGNGNFTENSETTFEGVDLSSIAFADVDNDNDQDLLLTGSDSNDLAIAKLYINDGTGIFTENTESTFDGVYRSSIAFSDVDNDNDQDVIITGLDNNDFKVLKLYFNNGGTFVEQNETPLNAVFSGSIAFADVDNDNDEDLLFTGLNSSNLAVTILYINDGNGNFEEKTNESFDPVAFSAVAFSDIDGDNDSDVMIIGRNRSNTLTAKLYINDGLGNFSLEAGTPFERVMNGSIAFADIDGDDDPDLFLSGLGTTINEIGPVSKIYRNRSMVKTAVEETVASKSRISIHPNPAISNNINVHIGTTSKKPILVSVFNSLGKLCILQKKTNSLNNESFKIDLSGLESGIYLLQINDGKMNSTQKFVIQ